MIEEQNKIKADIGSDFSMFISIPKLKNLI